MALSPANDLPDTNMSTGALQIEEHRRDVIVCVNPTAGAVSSDGIVGQTNARLREAGFAVHVMSELGEIISLVDQLAPDRLRTVIAAGGDGTAALLANSLPPSVPITPLPLGTENLLAKHLGASNRPGDIAELVQGGLTAPLDAGLANDRLFMVVASCGFDAEVVHQVHCARSGHIHHFSYAKPILRSIRRYQYPTFRITSDTPELELRAKWAFVFNLPQYAMGLPIARCADGMDGKLDLCTFRGGNLLNGLLYLFGVITRQHHRWRDIQLHQVTRIRIESDGRVPYQLDGDPGGYLPLEIQMIPRRLRVMVSRLWLARRGMQVELFQNQ